MHIRSYEQVDSLLFDVSTGADCERVFGPPLRAKRNRYGYPELHYEAFVARFDDATGSLRECTLLPYHQGTINDIEVTWDRRFLQQACEADGEPKMCYGFVILYNLGVAITGIHDQDVSQLAVTAFAKGVFDQFVHRVKPFKESQSGLPE